MQVNIIDQPPIAASLTSNGHAHTNGHASRSVSVVKSASRISPEGLTPAAQQTGTASVAVCKHDLLLEYLSKGICAGLNAAGQQTVTATVSIGSGARLRLAEKASAHEHKEKASKELRSAVPDFGRTFRLAEEQRERRCKRWAEDSHRPAQFGRA